MGIENTKGDNKRKREDEKNIVESQANKTKIGDYEVEGKSKNLPKISFT
jgi:hypothetical protein